jgi:hypothetical protein
VTLPSSGSCHRLLDCAKKTSCRLGKQTLAEINEKRKTDDGRIHALGFAPAAPRPPYAVDVSSSSSCRNPLVAARKLSNWRPPMPSRFVALSLPLVLSSSPLFRCTDTMDALVGSLAYGYDHPFIGAGFVSSSSAPLPPSLLTLFLPLPSTTDCSSYPVSPA